MRPRRTDARRRTSGGSDATGRSDPGATTGRPRTRRWAVMAAAAIVGVGAVAPALPAGASGRPRIPERIADVLSAQAVEALDALDELRSAPATEPHLSAAVERWTSARQAVAVTVAQRATVEAAALDEAWTRTSDTRLRVVLTALAQVGDPYRRRSQGPDAFDCSGLTRFAWWAGGLDLPSNSSAQVNASQRVTASDLEAGDLVFRPGHVMLYLGAGQAVVESPESGRHVRVRNWGRVTRFADPLRT